MAQMHTTPSVSSADYTAEEKQVIQDLLEMGLLTEVRPKSTECKLHRPVGTVTGKPVSETIIEERR